MASKIVIVYKLYDHDTQKLTKDCFVVCSKDPILADDINRIKSMVQSKEKSRLVGYQFICGIKCSHEHELPIEDEDPSKTKIPETAGVAEMKKCIYRYDKGQNPCSHAREQSYEYLTGVHDRLDYVGGQLVVKVDQHLFGNSKSSSDIPSAPVSKPRGRGRTTQPPKMAPMPVPVSLSLPPSSSDQMVLTPAELSVINGVKPRPVVQKGGDYAATMVLIDRVLKSLYGKNNKSEDQLHDEATDLFNSGKISAKEYSIVTATISARFSK